MIVRGHVSVNSGYLYYYHVTYDSLRINQYVVFGNEEVLSVMKITDTLTKAVF